MIRACLVKPLNSLYSKYCLCSREDVVYGPHNGWCFLIERTTVEQCYCSNSHNKECYCRALGLAAQITSRISLVTYSEHLHLLQLLYVLSIRSKLIEGGEILTHMLLGMHKHASSLQLALVLNKFMMCGIPLPNCTIELESLVELFNCYQHRCE